MIEKAKTASAQYPLDPAAIIKDTAVTAIIAFAIFGPIIGLKTVSIGNSLTLQQSLGPGRCTCRNRRRRPPAPQHLRAGAALSIRPARACRRNSAPLSSRLGKYVGIVLLIIAITLALHSGRRPPHRRSRHPDAHLCDARLGPQHRCRPRRLARFGLRRLLRGRRLLLRASLDDLFPDLVWRRHHALGLLAGAAAGRYARRALGRYTRLSRSCDCAATISPS